MVAVFAWAETFGLARVFDEGLIEGFWWASGAAVVAATSMWFVLDLSWWARLRRPPLHAATY